MAGSTAGTLLYTIWVLENRYDPRVEAVISSLSMILLYLLFAGLGIHIARRGDYDRRLRKAWLLLALGAIANTVAEGVWFYYESFLGLDPFPSLSDLFYLVYYPLTLAGLLLFPFSEPSRQERITLGLDLVIVLIACTMIFWYFILAPLSLTILQDLEGFVAIAYPVGDLLLLVGVVALTERDVQKVAHWTLFFLALGLLFMTVADGLFAYYETNDLVYRMPYLNIGWFTAILLHLFAAFQQLTTGEGIPATADLKFSRSHHFLRLILPYLAVSIGIGLLLVAVQGSIAIDLRLRGVLFGSLLLVGLALFRQYSVLQENIRLYNEMKRMASTDSLTGVYNRHFFNEVFRLKIERAKRYQESLSVLLIDVNGFKRINDTFGHLRGDVVLKTVAQMLASQLRSADLIARFGGDEFVVILPETNHEKAKVAAGRIESAVLGQRQENVPLSVSIGVATYQPGLSPEQLLEQADRDLYRQKSTPLGPAAGPNPQKTESEIAPAG